MSLRQQGWLGEKEFTVFTPSGVCQFIFDLLNRPEYQTIFDPAIGTGNLIIPWKKTGRRIIGVDIIDYSPPCDLFIKNRYEDLKNLERPDLIIMNPPFNLHRKLYPMIFLVQSFKLFGYEMPICMISPMGLRLNQKKTSTRKEYLRTCGAEITSIISLPLDIFDKINFYTEILCFNIPNLKPHYFLPPAYYFKEDTCMK